MSWHFLQGPEGDYSQADCLDGTPYAPLRSRTTAEGCCLSGSGTAVSSDFQFGTTLKHSTGHRGEAQLTLFPAASPAKTSVQRVRVQDLPEPVAAFGSRCCELLERCGLVLSSRKTVRTCVAGALAPSFQDLPAWGMTSGGVCWELGTSARITAETECGYLPTPTAQQYGSNKGGSAVRSGKVPHSLATIAKMFPTPCQRDWKDTTSKQGNRKSPNLGVVAGGSLNPPWVEWLMGWPIGWTDLKPLATDKFREWLRLHGKS